MPDQPANSKRILLVEDDQYLRELYVEILQDAGYAVDSAADGEEGYQKILAGGYDLILMDVMMPKMDGMSILEKIKNETPPKVPNGRIVILSNLGQDSAIAKATALGASGYMIKSDHTPDQIISKVKEYLAGV